MNTKMLLEEFRKILSYEERARHFYDHYIEMVEDADIKKQLISIRNDEIEHIKIAKDLVKSVS